MYIQYELGEMQFEWDSEKEQINIQKHDMSFEAAARAFNPSMRLRMDLRQNYGEVRWLGISLCEGTTLFVVFTMRGHVHRIISARKADRDEAQGYFKNL